MTISIIVAMAENRVIGRDGELPWYLPADLKHFKKLTLGHTVIMGRKTHESILARLGRPLPKRRSLVLSRDVSYSGGGQTEHGSGGGQAEHGSGGGQAEHGSGGGQTEHRSGGGQTEHRGAPGVEVASSLEQALELAGENNVTPDIFVIGGAAVFAEALPLADCLYLTRVHAEVEGDVFFPEVDPESWRLVSEQRHQTDARHAFPYSFEVYERGSQPQSPG